MATLYCGIDPGFSGGISLLNPWTRSLTVYDMPTYKDSKGKTITNFRALGTMLIPEPGYDRYVAVIEKVHAMRGQGVSSMFRFGENFGALQMAIVGHGYEIHYVAPAVWKKHFKLGKDKNGSRALITQRFPDAASYFTRVKDDGRAEASLLALYGLETIK